MHSFFLRIIKILLKYIKMKQSDSDNNINLFEFVLFHILYWVLQRKCFQCFETVGSGIKRKIQAVKFQFWQYTKISGFHGKLLENEAQPT